MKVLFFGDTHGSEQYHDRITEKAREADIVVCVGDFTVFENDLSRILSHFNNINKPVLLIHGNHESASSVTMEASNHPNLHFIHKTYYIIGDVVFFGFGGGGFNTYERNFDVASKNFLDELAALKQKSGIAYKLVLVTHAPPYNTTLDDLGDHVGVRNFRTFIEQVQPVLAVAGHIHEAFDEEDHIKHTQLINPGPQGKIIEF